MSHKDRKSIYSHTVEQNSANYRIKTNAASDRSQIPSCVENTDTVENLCYVPIYYMCRHRQKFMETEER